jgi:hypothetical protein
MAYSYSISSSNITTNSVDINWSVNNTSGTFGIKFVVYNNNTGTTLHAFQTVGAGGSTSGSATDSGLSAGTAYRYYIDIYRFSTGAYIESKSVLVTTASAPPPPDPVWSGNTFSNGTRDQSYYSSVYASDSVAFDVYSNSLPPGLSLVNNAPYATISGTPTSTGTYSFVLRAYSSGGWANNSFSITISPPSEPTWGTVSLADGKVGTAYSASITPSNATSITGQSTTAPGISATVSGGSILLSGTPTSSGTYTVLGTANGYSGTTPADLNTSLYIAPLVPPQWSDQTVSTTFVVGTAYSDSVTATNATGYSVTSGALPSGISLDAGTGVLSGTPTTKQTFSFAIRASNTDGNVTTQTFAGTTSAPPVWTDQVLADIYQGRTYSDGVAATSPISSSPTQYTVTTGALPTGLALSATTGAITGKTYSSGTYSFSLTATNADGDTTQAFSGTIILAPYWTDNTLSSFIYGVDYFNGVAAANSPTYSVSTGSLPAGITLNTGTGALTGTPTGTVGTPYSFTLTATNGLGSIDQAFSGQVQPDLGGKFRVYSGSAWVDGDVYVYDGSTWVLGQAYVYDGSNWIKTEY